MPHNPDAFPLMVYGDGIVSRHQIVRKLLGVNIPVNPVPVVFHISGNGKRDEEVLKDARALANKMRPSNETILICKVIEVVK